MEAIERALGRWLDFLIYGQKLWFIKRECGVDCAPMNFVIDTMKLPSLPYKRDCFTPITNHSWLSLI